MPRQTEDHQMTKYPLIPAFVVLSCVHPRYDQHNDMQHVLRCCGFIFFLASA
jgi:hypothetical protein